MFIYLFSFLSFVSASTAGGGGDDDESLSLHFETKPSRDVLLNYGSGYYDIVTDGKEKVGRISGNHSVDELRMSYSLQTRKRFKYGRYSSQLKTQNVKNQPKAGVLTGFFSYFNNGTDFNGNNISDNGEIDFEFLAANLSVLYVTVWTDHGDGKGINSCRTINMRTGIANTKRTNTTGTEKIDIGETIEPITDFDPSSKYYEYGYDWLEDSIVFWIIDPTNNKKTILWNFKPDEKKWLPVPAAYLLVSVRHIENWPASGVPGSIERPTFDVSVHVKSLKYLPLSKWYFPDSSDEKAPASNSKTTTIIISVVVVVLVIIAIIIATVCIIQRKSSSKDDTDITAQL